MTLARCDELFEAIRTSNNAEKITNAYSELFKFYPLLNYQIGRGSIYWRGRISESSGFNSTSELGCPPPNLCKAGRLNHPGKSCFYAATRRTTVFTEIHAKPGDFVHLVGIRFQFNRSARIIAIGDLFHVYKTGYARSIGKDPDKALSRMLNTSDRSLATQILYVDAFLSQVLADPYAREKDYLPTRILAELAYKKTRASGIFYPSVQDHIGMNMSLLPDAYEASAHIVMSQVVHVKQKHEFGFFESLPVKNAISISDEGEFIWGDTPTDLHANLFNLTKDEADFASQHDSEDPNAMLDLMSFSNELRKNASGKRQEL